ncbi:MAG: hypothetical protein CMJ19_22435 [Phycisphaeraceae bacterium]|nr:hypothetical protein [Phycisphaeraceae bacterium]
MSSEPIEYLEPWWSTADQDVVFHEQFHEQLEREVGPGHVLYHVPVRLIARHDASDDCLFELLDGSGRIAIVHLTWSRTQERLPWPETIICDDLQTFVTDHMLPEHEDWQESQVEETVFDDPDPFAVDAESLQPGKSGQLEYQFCPQCRTRIQTSDCPRDTEWGGLPVSICPNCGHDTKQVITTRGIVLAIGLFIVLLALAIWWANH